MLFRSPFLARLGELTLEHGGDRINADFFYSTPNASADEFPSGLAERCAAAGVRLHRRITERDGTLTPQEIAACLQPGSSVWFCGPAGWGKALSQALMAGGLPATAFHQEAFDFR